MRTSTISSSVRALSIMYGPLPTITPFSHAAGSSLAAAGTGMNSWNPATAGKLEYGASSVTVSVIASSSTAMPEIVSAVPSSFSWPPSMKPIR